jgi:alpha-1,6-mannosyltransferase
VAEAQACGLPVVGVRQGALIERVPARIGALAKPNDPADFARRIRYIAENGRIEMSFAARRHAEENYEWRSAIDLLLVHYEEILRQKEPSSHLLDKTD